MAMAAEGQWTSSEEANLAEDAQLLQERAPQKAVPWRRGLLVAVVATALFCVAGGVGFGASRGVASASPAARTGARLDIISAKKSDDSDGKSEKPQQSDKDEEALESAKNKKKKAEAEVKKGQSKPSKGKKPKKSKGESESTEPLKEQYCLAVMDFDGEGQENAVPVKVGDVVIKLGDDTDEGWAWVEKVPPVPKKGKKAAKKGKDEPVEAGYVPKWAIEPIPDGSGEEANADDTADEEANADDKKGKKGEKEDKDEKEDKKGKLSKKHR